MTGLIINSSFRALESYRPSSTVSSSRGFEEIEEDAHGDVEVLPTLATPHLTLSRDDSATAMTSS